MLTDHMEEVMLASDQSGSFTVNSGSKSWVQRIPPKSTYKTGKRLHRRPTGCQKKVSSLTNPTLEKTVPEVANPQTPLQNIFQKTVPKVVNTHKSCDNYANYEDRRSPACGIPISPIKVMRSEMLKERFANIIGKARNQITSHDTQQRQQERKAARLAIEKVERSVEFEDNISSLRCVENMIGHFSFIDPLTRYDTTYVEAARSMTDKLSPLERLGLYLKDDYQFMHEDEQCDDILLPQEYEEGEIID